MKWLVFSDLHKAVHNYISKEGRKKLIDKIAGINNKGSVDFVLFTGDLFNQGIGNSNDIIRFIKQITDSLSPQTKLFICPGNHDIKRQGKGERQIASASY